MWWLKYGHILREAREKSYQVVSNVRPRNLLVMCYGNIYRSPIAAAMLTSLLADSVDVKSAGFHERDGRSSPRDFVALARSYGVQIGQHRSKLVTEEQIAAADIIVIMDRWNWTALSQMSETADDKTVWLGAFDGNATVEIVDPYGKEPSTVVEIVNKIRAAVDDLADRLATSVGSSAE